MTESLLERWNLVCDRLVAVGFENLSEAEQLWIAVREFIDSVNNGGIPSYFYNSGADHLEACKVSLEVLAAPRVLIQLERACSLFPGGVPSTVEERNAVLDTWDERVDSELEEIDRQFIEHFPELELSLASYIFKFLR